MPTAVRIESTEAFREHVRSGRWQNRDALVEGAPFTPGPGRLLSASTTCNTLKLEVDSDGKGFQLPLLGGLLR